MKQLADRLDQHNAFAKGQFVAWKPGLNIKGYADYGEPAIEASNLAGRSSRPAPPFSRVGGRSMAGVQGGDCSNRAEDQLPDWTTVKRWATGDASYAAWPDEG